MDNLNSYRLERTAAFVVHKMNNFQFDIIALSETHIVGEGQLKKEQGQYTFFWKGLDHEQPKLHGVGYAIQNYILSKLTELPMNAFMTLKNQHAPIISTYAQTLDAEVGFKEDSILSLITFSLLLKKTRSSFQETSVIELAKEWSNS